MVIATAALAAPLQWTALPSLPDPQGFAGLYAGVSGGTILAAGGHHFEGGVPAYQGGKKLWSDAIYWLNPTANKWETAAARLPRRLGDGASVSYRDQVICMGGGDAQKAYREVFAMRWKDGQVEFSTLPPLPAPCLKMEAALLDDVIYVAGGRDDPNSTRALHTFWSLDLSRPTGEQRWITLPPWPGPARMMAIVTAHRGSIYVMGGIELAADQQGRPKNLAPYLADNYRYTPGRNRSEGKWERLKDVPRSIAGSQSPAWSLDPETLLVFGGVDGAIEAIIDRASIRSLPGDILAYHVAKNEWTTYGEMPAGAARVNGPALPWKNGYALISGEHLPGLRTPTCWLVTPAPAKGPR